MSPAFAAVRVLRGMTQAELAAVSGVSQTEISHVEAGHRDPAPARLDDLARALSVPTGLVSATAADPQLLHHLQSSLSARTITRLRAELTLDQVRLERLIPSTVAPELGGVPTGAAPGDAAHTLRQAWRVADGPIPNLVALLEAHGIPCLIRDLSSVKVHALGNWPASSRAFLVLDERAPSRQRRLAAAHELGHAVLRPSPEPESAAETFALEFLMPSSDIAGAFGNLTWSRLGELEELWGVPAASIARHARDIGAITPSHHRRLHAQLLDMGSDAAPGSPEQPTLLADTVRRRRAPLAQVAAEAFVTVEELRRRYLEGAQ